jgi:Ni/Fe-hydrogenase subunit HybB-like protein
MIILLIALLLTGLIVAAAVTVFDREQPSVLVPVRVVENNNWRSRDSRRYR